MKLTIIFTKNTIKVKLFFSIILVLFSITVFDVCIGNAQTVLDTIHLPGNSCAQSININSLTNRIYVHNGSLKVINGKINRIIDNIGVDGESRGVEVNPLNNRIYVGILSDSSVTVIDGQNHQIIDVIKVDDGSAIDEGIPVAALGLPFGPEEIGINITTNLIYLTNFVSDTLTVIDGNIKQVVHTIPVGNAMKTVGINPITNRIYVIGKSVKVIDGGTNQVIDTIRVRGRSVRVNPITNRIYIAGDNLNIIDGRTNRVMDTIMMKNGVGVIGINPLLNRIYVSGFDDNFNNILQTIDGDTNQVINSVELGETVSPSGIKVNPVSKLIYITNCLLKNIVVLRDDAKIIPTPNTTSTPLPDNLFTVNCDKKFTKGHRNFDKLVLESGGNENCVVKLTKLEPGSFVEFSTNIVAGSRPSITVYPISGVVNFNGELEFTISAINKGTDWISWTIKNKNDEFDFSKKAFDKGLARGMFVEVE